MAVTLRLAVALAVTLSLCSAPAWSATVYITDAHEFTLRTGPSTSHKIVQMLKTGTPLQLLEDSDEWVRVRTPEGREGWMVKRFFTTATPKAMQVEQLRQQLGQLQDESSKAQKQAKLLDTENRELKAALDSTNSELAKTSQSYETLRVEAAEVIEIKRNYIEARAGLVDISAFVSSLNLENESLHSTEHLDWFLAGAGAVLVPWFVGYLIGRFGGKRKQRISF